MTEYTININVNSLNSINELFNERNYIINGDFYDINLSINYQLLNDLFYDDKITSIFSNNENIISHYAYSTFANGNSLLGLRFLEILATKIFGHAKSRAGIKNDSDFYKSIDSTDSIIYQLTNGINSSLNSKKNDIFNLCNSLNRIENFEQGIFNFENTQWIFPILFTSSFTDKNYYMNKLNEGPNRGGSILSNGEINIPILIRFIK